MKKKDLEELIIIADQLKEAAIKVVGNEADRSLHQHIGNLYEVVMLYINKRYSLT